MGGFFASARLLPGGQAALVKFPPLPRLTPIPELAEAEMEERKGLEPERQPLHGNSRLVVSTALGMMLLLGLASAMALVTIDAATPASVPQARGHSHAAACEGNEELFHGLCYKKCSLLAGEEMPVRASASSCCQRWPCRLGGQRVAKGTCQGFGVGGQCSGEGCCPHEPCSEDQELSQGTCHRKCSLLTGGEYPHRLTAEMCCKAQGGVCLKAGQSKTSEAFRAGEEEAAVAAATS